MSPPGSVLGAPPLCSYSSAPLACCVPTGLVLVRLPPMGQGRAALSLCIPAPSSLPDTVSVLYQLVK